MARKKVYRHSHNPQISTLNFKVSAMIMHLPTSLKTMCSRIESKSVNAILGTWGQQGENLLATAFIAEHFDFQ